MLTYELKHGSHIPLYEELYQLIRNDIAAGRLKKNEKLPSKRSLAKHLGVSTITVENAYELLLVEGYIYSLVRKGYFVSDLKMPEEGRLLLVKERVQEEKEDPEETGDEASGVPAAADFAGNQTEPDSFPFSIWAKLTREVLSVNRDELMTNPPTGGVMQLRRAIAEHLRAFRSIRVHPRQIIIGAGTEYLYGLLIQLLGYDKCYAAEDPGYRKVSMIYESCCVRHVSIPLDASGISVRHLETSPAQVVHITPSHHFPTGITMPVMRRMELLEWAGRKQDRFLIEDDYDSEFRMNLRPVPSLISMDKTERVIYMNTFTKTLSSTIRISYMVLPVPLLQEFERRMSFYSCTVPTFEQYTLAAFIQRGYFEKHISRMRTASRRKRDLLLRLIRENDPGDRISISETNAGLHFLMNIRLQEDGHTFADRARAAGVRLRGLDTYFEQEPDAELSSMWQLGDQQLDHTFVMNYSSVPEERMIQAAAVMKKLLEEEGR